MSIDRENAMDYEQFMNEQMKFLFRMFLHMDDDFKVHLTPGLKLEIMADIKPDAKKPMESSRQYVRKLKTKGMIKPIGQSSHMINPDLYRECLTNDKYQELKEEYFFLDKKTSKGKVIPIKAVRQVR